MHAVRCIFLRLSFILVSLDSCMFGSISRKNLTSEINWRNYDLFFDIVLSNLLQISVSKFWMKPFTQIDSFPSVFHISQYSHYSLSLVHFLPLSQSMQPWDWTLDYKGNQLCFNQFFIPLSHMSLSQSSGII